MSTQSPCHYKRCGLLHNKTVVQESPQIKLTWRQFISRIPPQAGQHQYEWDGFHWKSNMACLDYIPHSTPGERAVPPELEEKVHS